MRDGNAAMIGALKNVIGCRRGATAVEYGLVLAFVCVVVIATISVIGGKTFGMWTNINAKIPVVQG